MRYKKICGLLTIISAAIFISSCSDKNIPNTDLTVKETGVAEASVSVAETDASYTETSAFYSKASTKNPTETKRSREKGDYSCFDNCAFVGNSRTLDLKDYGLIKNAYASIGANVSSVYTKSAPGKNVPIMDEIGERHYEKYFLQFGENECGWPNIDIFIEKYTKIINDIKVKDPTAKIYVQSIIPITASASLRAEDDCTNERINIFNARIEKMSADENVEFIDIGVPFRDAHGCLPEEAAPDGMHLNYKYCKIWLDYLADNI